MHYTSKSYYLVRNDVVVPLVDAAHAAGPLHAGRVQDHVPPCHLVPTPLMYLILGIVALFVRVASSVLNTDRVINKIRKYKCMVLVFKEKSIPP